LASNGGSGANYGNANVTALLSTGIATNITTTGNIAGSFFIGDGSQLTNLPAGNYGNANVAAYLPTYTGNISAGNVIATTYYGDGSNLTGITGGGAAEASFTIQSADFTAAAGNRYGVDTTSGAVTATLPATPASGAAVFFADAGGAYATNNLVIDPNGQTIMGVSGSMTVSTNNQSVGLFYNGTTWRTYNAG
jgi:hypothetical protein